MADEELPEDPTEALAFALALFIEQTEKLIELGFGEPQQGSTMSLGRAAIAKWQAARGEPHPDARRLDLIEGQGLRPVQWTDGAWSIENRRGCRLIGPRDCSLREAIDAAAEALEGNRDA